MEYENQSKNVKEVKEDKTGEEVKEEITQVLQERMSKRQITDIQSDIKEKLTGAYFTKDDCCTDIYAFAKKVKIEGKNGRKNYFEEIIHAMLFHYSPKLMSLFWEVLRKINEEYLTLNINSMIFFLYSNIR